jgi:hypothetical protein
MIQTSAREERQHGRLWVSFLTGPVVYIVYFIAVWALGEFGCVAGIQQLTLFGQNPIRLGVLVLTAIAALLTLIIGIVSLRRWRQLREAPGRNGGNYAQFMSFVGAWLNGFFTLVILMNAIPMLLGSGCNAI